MPHPAQAIALAAHSDVLHFPAHRYRPPPREIKIVKMNLKPLVMLVGATLLPVDQSPAQQLDQSLYSNLEWRMIGPFRAGRTIGATGVRGQPGVFYIGVNNGGVWKTTDYGRV